MGKCSIKSCKNISASRGWCPKHYTKWQRHGDPLYQKVKPLNKDLNCVVKGCERKRHVRQYCTTHYMKIKRTGTLEKVNFTPEWKKRNVQARLSALSKIDATPSPTKRRGYLAINTVSDIKAKARGRGIEWTLTDVQAYYLFIGDCTYCGRPSGWPNDRNGIDRVNNLHGYHHDNSISCCFQCNTAKGGLTQNEFYSWIRDMYKRALAKGDIEL